MVKVLTTKIVITIDGNDLQLVITNSDKGDIEGATAKIEYELSLTFVLFKIFVLHRYEECS